MNQLTPLPSKPNRTPLLVGVLLVCLGLLLFFRPVFFWPEWLPSWRSAAPFLITSLGILLLWRHLTWPESALLEGRRRPGGVIRGTVLVFIGLAWLGASLGRADFLSSVGRFWPLTLVAIGSVKLLDYFLHPRQARIRFRELIGAICIIGLGLISSRASRVEFSVPGLEWPLTLSGRVLRLGQWSGPSFGFSAEQRFPGAARIVIENRYGDVRVTAGAGDDVLVRVEKQVYDRSESVAKGIADQIEVLGDERDGLRLRINRRELEAQRYRFKTHLEIQAPAGTALEIDNSGGVVEVRNMQGACRIHSRSGPVIAESVGGPLDVESESGDVTVRRAGARVQVQARRGDIAVNEVRGDLVAENSHHSTRIENVSGSVRVSGRHGSVLIDGAGSDVSVDAPNSSVDILRVKGASLARGSHGRMRVRDADGPLTAANDYGEIVLQAIRSAAAISSEHGSVNAQDLLQGIRVTGGGTEVTLNRVVGPVSVQASLGDVDLGAIEGAVDVSIRNGDVRLRLQPQAPVNVTSQNGDIVLRMPRSTSALLDLTAVAGAIDNDLDPRLSVSRSGGSAALKGALNAGGPRISLRTEHGTIRLQPD